MCTPLCGDRTLSRLGQLYPYQPLGRHDRGAQIRLKRSMMMTAVTLTPTPTASTLRMLVEAVNAVPVAVVAAVVAPFRWTVTIAVTTLHRRKLAMMPR